MRVVVVCFAVAVAGLLLSLTGAPSGSRSARADVVRASDTRAHARRAPLTGIHKIQHVVIIMQENRSFDSYFGTYPGRQRDPRC